MWLEQYKAGQPSAFVFHVAYGFRKPSGVMELIRETEMQLLPGMLSPQLLLFPLPPVPPKIEGRTGAEELKDSW